MLIEQGEKLVIKTVGIFVGASQPREANKVKYRRWYRRWYRTDQVCIGGKQEFMQGEFMQPTKSSSNIEIL